MGVAQGSAGPTGWWLQKGDIIVSDPDGEELAEPSKPLHGS
jgi:hypothetical protein